MFNTKNIPRNYLEVKIMTLKKHMHVGDNVRYVSPFTHATIDGTILMIFEDGAIRVKYVTMTGIAYLTSSEDDLELLEN